MQTKAADKHWQYDGITALGCLPDCALTPIATRNAVATGHRTMTHAAASLAAAAVLLVSSGAGALGCSRTSDQQHTEKNAQREHPSDTKHRTSDLGKKENDITMDPADTFELTDSDKQALLEIAKRSVESWVRTSRMPSGPDPVVSAKVKEKRACFVTLKINGSLRGCIGSLQPRRALLDDVRHNAVAAAVSDPRFDPVTVGELGSLQYSISVLDLPKPLSGVSKQQLPAYLAKHRPGVIIEYNGRSSTFLPSVWEELPEPIKFLQHLCLKQGSNGDCWKSEDAAIQTYGAINFGHDH